MLEDETEEPLANDASEMVNLEVNDHFIPDLYVYDLFNYESLGTISDYTILRMLPSEKIL